MFTVFLLYTTLLLNFYPSMQISSYLTEWKTVCTLKPTNLNLHCFQNTVCISGFSMVRFCLCWCFTSQSTIFFCYVLMISYLPGLNLVLIHSLSVLLKDQTQCLQWVSNLRSSNLKCNTLSLSHHAPIGVAPITQLCMCVIEIVTFKRVHLMWEKWFSIP